jgi:hypothetical protein
MANITINQIYEELKKSPYFQVVELKNNEFTGRKSVYVLSKHAPSDPDFTDSWFDEFDIDVNEDGEVTFSYEPYGTDGQVGTIKELLQLTRANEKPEYDEYWVLKSLGNAETDDSAVNFLKVVFGRNINAEMFVMAREFKDADADEEMEKSQMYLGWLKFSKLVDDGLLVIVNPESLEAYFDFEPASSSVATKIESINDLMTTRQVWDIAEHLFGNDTDNFYLFGNGVSYTDVYSAGQEFITSFTNAPVSETRYAEINKNFLGFYKNNYNTFGSFEINIPNSEGKIENILIYHYDYKWHIEGEYKQIKDITTIEVILFLYMLNEYMQGKFKFDNIESGYKEYRGNYFANAVEDDEIEMMDKLVYAGITDKQLKEIFREKIISLTYLAGVKVVQNFVFKLFGTQQVEAFLSGGRDVDGIILYDANGVIKANRDTLLTNLFAINEGRAFELQIGSIYILIGDKTIHCWVDVNGLWYVYNEANDESYSQVTKTELFEYLTEIQQNDVKVREYTIKHKPDVKDTPFFVYLGGSLIAKFVSKENAVDYANSLSLGYIKKFKYE